MTLAWFSAVLFFAAAIAFPPRPNELMATAAGATCGRRRSLPQALGVAVGLGAMVLALGLGFARAIAASPELYAALRWVGGAYLLWLAYQIATAEPADAADPDARPPGFLKAALFQWVNPKAWAFTLGGVAVHTHAGPEQMSEIVAMTLVFAPVTFAAMVVWTLFGVTMSRWLTSRARLRLFNGTMAVLMVASLIPLFIDL